MAGKTKKTVATALVWKRILAFIIDLMIIDIVVFYPFKGIISRIVPKDLNLIQEYMRFDQKTTNLIIALSFMIGILSVLYFALTEYKLNQSIGKMIFRIYVLSEGNELRLWQCFVRSLLMIPVFPFVLFWAIDPAYMFFNDKNQRLLEKWSRTRTVEEVAI